MFISIILIKLQHGALWLGGSAEPGGSTSRVATQLHAAMMLRWV